MYLMDCRLCFYLHCNCPLQIDWARLERDRLFAEGATWERVLHSKQSEAGELYVQWKAILLWRAILLISHPCMGSIHSSLHAVSPSPMLFASVATPWHLRW